MKFSTKVKATSINIYINGKLFVLFKREQFIGLQSWLSDHSDAKFKVLIKLKDGDIEITFEKRDKFEAFLKEIENAIDDIWN